MDTVKYPLSRISRLPPVACGTRGARVRSVPVERRFDVIVVGGGGSGLAAAASAAESGLKVVVLEKRPELGGTTGIAVGSFTASGTRWQAAKSIQDRPEAHEEDAGKFPPPDIEARGDSGLRRFFLDHAAETLDWLAGMGLAFHGPSPEPPNRVSRMHNVVPNAKAYIAALHLRLLKHGGAVVCDAVVETLVKEAGRVTGVEVRVGGARETFEAGRGVVLAAGDYANSPELIALHKGERFGSVEGINPHATGDGHRLAESAGAALRNMDITYGPELRFVPPPGKAFGQLLPSGGRSARILGALLPLVPRFLVTWMIKRLLVTWQHPENALFDDGAVLLNREGKRFCDERVRPDREIAVSRQTGKSAFILLDRRLAGRYGAWPHFISTAPQIAYAYVSDYLRLRPDVAAEGKSLEDLSRSRGLPPEEVRRTVEEYDRDARTGGTAPMEDGRWVLLGPAKAYFTTTEGGAAIDRSFRVLDASGAPIEGLYAVGQNGLGGQILWGHGLHIGWAMTSGRLVGKILAGSAP